MRRNTRLIALGFVCAAGMISSWARSAAQQPATPAVKLLIKEVPIGRVKPDKHSAMLAVSPDGKRVAYLASRGKRELVIIDGVEGKEYGDGIGHLVFSPDSKRVAYMATQRFGLDNAGAEADKRSVLGNILAGRRAVSGNLLIWYLAVVVDGVEMKAYDGVSGSARVPCRGLLQGRNVTNPRHEEPAVVTSLLSR